MKRLSSGLLCSTVWYKFTDVSEAIIVSIIKIHRSDDAYSQQL
jgi:hypothetical protein